MSRLFLVKTTNSLVGKQELSGQQTANFLLGRKNNHVSDVYHEYWWSSLLRDIARDVFANSESNSVAEDDVDGPSSDLTLRLIIPEDEDDSLIVLFPENLQQEILPIEQLDSIPEKRFSKMFNDIFYRPPELASLCVWDMMRNYIKEKKPSSKNPRKVYLNFKPGHPEYMTHCLKKLDGPVIPVLQGYRVPRNNFEPDRVKYAVMILVLFKPWSNYQGLTGEIT
ncbi:hypothetical protein C8R45DRAFT_1095366 [Mycena sanguinolenta]|nr:hypothetical protein C8R45DRAFT_1095366 [Mycena sanguinolenta]